MTTRRTIHRLELSAWLVVAGFVIGAGYREVQFLVSSEVETRELLGSGLTGALIAASLAGVELIFLPSRLGERWRRQPFAWALLSRAAVAAILIVCGLMVGNHFLIDNDFSSQYPFSGQLWLDLGVSFGAMIVLLFILQVRQIVGPRVLGDFVLGRYFRPVSEERVFLFLDLANSTALSQSLGDEKTHALLSQFFFDIGETIYEHEGETHRYVGDQVVVTWPFARGLEDARCVACVRDIDHEIKRRASEYEADFGFVPAFRAALHGGPVVAGECGAEKREIVYFGDTVNTAARVETLCKKLGHQLLVTQTLYDRLELPPDMAGAFAGAHQLKGREGEITVYAITWEPPSS